MFASITYNLHQINIKRTKIRKIFLQKLLVFIKKIVVSLTKRGENEGFEFRIKTT